MSKIISAKNEGRVWAKSSIAENIFFGPFQGDLSRLIKRVQFLDTPMRHFEDLEGQEYNSHGDFSWMGKVNPARSEEEQNMEAIHSSDDEIYFRTTRDITAGEELRVWMARSLEQKHGIRASISEEGLGGSQWICHKCQVTFPYSRALSVHAAFGCRELGSNSSFQETVNCKMADITANDDLAAESDADKRFMENISSDQSEDEQDNMRIGLKESYPRFLHLSSPEDTILRINSESSAALGHSRTLSNPKLASLISSFSSPRFRKLSNEPQSLAEYHKQEFRKKFQGNEHYLRRHLYRENMGKKGSMKYRRAFVMKEGYNYSAIQGDQNETLIKEEKDEFINCFREDYRLGRMSLSSSPTHEIFRRGKTIDAQKYNLQSENLSLNNSLNSYCNVTSSTGTRASFITRGYLTLKASETQQVDEERLSHETTHKCTCQEHNNARDTPKPPKSSGANEEMHAAEDVAVEESEERNLKTSSPKQLGVFESQTNLNSLGSYFVYQRMSREDEVSCRQHPQCHCYSTPPLYATRENVTRYHEPAFLVDPMYRYSTYPRMLPFLTHHTTNSPQPSPRNQGFTCEYCGKVYCRKYVLKIHMRTHTGFKPLRCKVCDKSFSDPSNMKKHVKLHETEDTVHRCRHCGRNFVRYRGLLNHIKSKHYEHASIDTL